MNYEDEARKVMERFKQQYLKSQNYNTPTQNVINEESQIQNNTPQINSQPSQIDIANIINKSNPESQPTQISNSYIPPTPRKVDIPTAGGTCQQCKTIHPPLRPGEVCPLAPKDTSTHNIDDSSVNKFLVDLRNMVISQMDVKEIKDGKKFFQYVTIELMKILESYTENQ